MSHKQALLLAALALSALPLTASRAEEANFAGPTVGLCVTAQHDKVDYAGFLAEKFNSGNDAGFDVMAGYGFNLSKDWVINVGASYTVNDTKFGTANYVDSGNQTVNTKLKSHRSVFVEPGYRITPQWLAYASFSYHEADGEYNDSLLGKGTVSTTGFGYGLGLGYVAMHNIEASVEVRQIDFSREAANLSTNKPRSQKPASDSTIASKQCC